MAPGAASSGRWRLRMGCCDRGSTLRQMGDASLLPGLLLRRSEHCQAGGEVVQLRG
uniref:Uncharacterized protein n=1 Tax=Triticum urartu TaxID=4572 RepID=A0A8R7TBT4_TRIUA